MGQTVTNDLGGKQSKIDFSLHGVTHAIREIAHVLSEGESKYGRNNWMLISVEDHLAHAMCHICDFLNGDRREDHLTNAACRILFAKELSTTLQ